MCVCVCVCVAMCVANIKMNPENAYGKIKKYGVMVSYTPL